MSDAAEFTDFWVACAAAGPVLLIPTYLMVRQALEPGSRVRSHIGVASVALLAAGSILALVQLAGGTPVHGRIGGRIVELVLLGLPVCTLTVSLLRQPRHSPDRGRSVPTTVAPRTDPSGQPDI
jgi:hypothetical protein